MRSFMLGLLLLIASAGVATAQDLVGNWKLVSIQTVVDGEPPKDLYGAKPLGHLTVSPNGRLLVLLTAETRQPGSGDVERAALHKSMLSYGGTYSIKGSEFVTKVDISWNETWNGTEQRRSFVLEGDKLTVDSAPAPSTLFPGKTVKSRLVWERLK